MGNLQKLTVVILETANQRFLQGEVSKATDLITDLSFDSIQIVSLIVAIEELFDITLDENDLDANRLRQVSYLLDIIEARQAEKEAT